MNHGCNEHGEQSAGRHVAMNESWGAMSMEDSRQVATVATHPLGAKSVLLRHVVGDLLRASKRLLIYVQDHHISKTINTILNSIDVFS